MGCEISQPKVGRCENRRSLQKKFAALRSRCENPSPHYKNRFSLRNHFAAKYTRFAAAKWLQTFHALRSTVSQPRRHFEGCFATAKPPFGTRVPLRSTVRPFRSCEMGCEINVEIPLTAIAPSRCEIHVSSLRKVPSAAKRNSDPWCPF